MASIVYTGVVISSDYGPSLVYMTTKYVEKYFDLALKHRQAIVFPEPCPRREDRN